MSFSLFLKVAAMSSKLEIRLYAHPVGTNTRSGIEEIFTLIWLAHAFRTRLVCTQSYFRFKRRRSDFKTFVFTLNANLHLVCGCKLSYSRRRGNIKYSTYSIMSHIFDWLPKVVHNVTGADCSGNGWFMTGWTMSLLISFVSEHCLPPSSYIYLIFTVYFFRFSFLPRTIFFHTLCPLYPHILISVLSTFLLSFIFQSLSLKALSHLFLNMLTNFCRCATGASNGITTAVLRYGFVNVGRAPVAPRNGSAALRWPQ